ncbi:MAG: hypothetical protein WC369_02155 [Dehalococcoidales bacterium]|jgi:hypothetical protein
MANENGWNNNDVYAVHAGFVFKRKDCSVVGAYRGRVEIPRKEMTADEVQRSHLVSKKYMRDIMGWEK